MELKKTLLSAFLLLVISVIFAAEDPNNANEIPDIIPAPAACSVFSGIKHIAVSSNFPSTAGIDGRLKALLKTRAKEQLKSASIQTASNLDAGSAILNLQLELLETLDPNNSIYRLQVHLKRDANLNDENSQCIVWSSSPLLAAIEKKAVHSRLENALSEQMRALIEAIHVCKEDEPEQKSPSKNAIPEKTAERKRGTKPDTVKKAYVASKNSSAFHKLTCSSSDRIKESNTVYYATREEAIEAGKRPCKSCNP